MTTVPASTAWGAYFFDIDPPAENRAISTPLNDVSFNSSMGIDSPLKKVVVPADRDDANKTNGPGSSQEPRQKAMLFSLGRRDRSFGFVVHAIGKGAVRIVEDEKLNCQFIVCERRQCTKLRRCPRKGEALYCDALAR